MPANASKNCRGATAKPLGRDDVSTVGLETSASGQRKLAGASHCHRAAAALRRSALVAVLGGLGGFDLLLQIDIRHSIVEFDAQPQRFFLLGFGRRPGDAPLSLGGRAGNADDVAALGADALLARVFIADFERALTRRAKDVNRHAKATPYRRKPTLLNRPQVGRRFEALIVKDASANRKGLRFSANWALAGGTVA